MSKFTKEQRAKILKRIIAKSNAEKSSKSEPSNNLSFEEKQQYWLKKLFTLIKQTASVSEDPFQLFNRNNYDKWKSEEEDLDKILEYVIDALDHEYNGNGVIKKQINKKLQQY